MKQIITIPIEFDEHEDYSNDCPIDNFTPTFLPPVKRIIAIGDIHGDLNLAIESFKAANLIEQDNNGMFRWIAEPPDTVVVQVGDQIDSCRPTDDFNCQEKKAENDMNEDMKVIDFFNYVNKLANEKGGVVYSLLGNHELMNAEGYLNYVSYENYHNFNYEINNKLYSGISGRRNGFKPGGEIAKMLGCSRKSMIIIGNNMFVHAGLVPSLVQRLDNTNLDEYNKLKYINSTIRKWLLGKKSNNNTDMLMNNMKSSPFWTRLFSNINKEQCNDVINNALEIYKINKLIVGHSPQEYINGTCSNRIFRIDGAFSRSFDNFGRKKYIQVLEIINDNEFKIITKKRD